MGSFKASLYTELLFLGSKVYLPLCFRISLVKYCQHFTASLGGSPSSVWDKSWVHWALSKTWQVAEVPAASFRDAVIFTAEFLSFQTLPGLRCAVGPRLSTNLRLSLFNSDFSSSLRDRGFDFCSVSNGSLENSTLGYWMLFCKLWVTPWQETEDHSYIPWTMGTFFVPSADFTSYFLAHFFCFDTEDVQIWLIWIKATYTTTKNSKFWLKKAANLVKRCNLPSKCYWFRLSHRKDANKPTAMGRFSEPDWKATLKPVARGACSLDNS